MYVIIKYIHKQLITEGGSITYFPSTLNRQFLSVCYLSCHFLSFFLSPPSLTSLPYRCSCSVIVATDHTQSHTHTYTLTLTLSRNPLDKQLAHHRELYLTTHNIHNGQTSMPLVGFKHAIPASKQLQTEALVCTATRIVFIFLFYEYLM